MRNKVSASRRPPLLVEFEFRLGVCLLLLSCCSCLAGVVDFTVINMRSAKDVTSFVTDEYGSTVTDIDRSLTIGISCKPMSAARARYYVDVVFLNKSSIGTKSFTSIATYELPNEWGKFLVSSGNVLRQEKVATSVTANEVWWVYPDKEERHPEEDFLSVDYSRYSSGSKPWGWFVRLRDGTETLKVVSSLYEAETFVKDHMKQLNAYSSKRVPLKKNAFRWMPVSR